MPQNGFSCPGPQNYSTFLQNLKMLFTQDPKVADSYWLMAYREKLARRDCQHLLSVTEQAPNVRGMCYVKR
jgi:hypothetical protein